MIDDIFNNDYFRVLKYFYFHVFIQDISSQQHSKYCQYKKAYFKNPYKQGSTL